MLELSVEQVMIPSPHDRLGNSPSTCQVQKKVLNSSLPLKKYDMAYLMFCFIF